MQIKLVNIDYPTTWSNYMKDQFFRKTVKKSLGYLYVNTGNFADANFYVVDKPITHYTVNNLTYKKRLNTDYETMYDNHLVITNQPTFDDDLYVQIILGEDYVQNSKADQERRSSELTDMIYATAKRIHSFFEVNKININTLYFNFTTPNMNQQIHDESMTQVDNISPIYLEDKSVFKPVFTEEKMDLFIASKEQESFLDELFANSIDNLKFAFFTLQMNVQEEFHEMNFEEKLERSNPKLSKFLKEKNLKTVLTPNGPTILSEEEKTEPKKTFKKEEVKAQDIDFSNVIGQERAKKALRNGINSVNLNLKINERPSSFLFVGPTGVGKTEIAKTFANNLGRAFLRLDCSEYASDMAAAKFTGAAPGYAGYDHQGVHPFEVLKENPGTVVLLDEFEKADDRVQKLFMNILEEGKFKDFKGNEYDFHEAIIIGTSNASVEETERHTIGFGGAQVDKMKKEDPRDEIAKSIAPELVNRFENLVYFEKLTEDEYWQIFENVLAKLLGNSRLDEEAKASFQKNILAKKAEILATYNPNFGARNVAPLTKKLVLEQIEAIEEGNSVNV